jgi:hypothetical protein
LLLRNDLRVAGARQVLAETGSVKLDYLAAGVIEDGEVATAMGARFVGLAGNCNALPLRLGEE